MGDGVRALGAGGGREKVPPEEDLAEVASEVVFSAEAEPSSLSSSWTRFSSESAMLVALGLKVVSY